MVADSPITQVAHPDDNRNNQYQQFHDDDEMSEPTREELPQYLKLDLRGTRVELDRETLMNLPESLLIVMFPNGLVLGRQERSDYEEDSQDSVGGEEINYVDIDPACLEYVRRFYREAQDLRESSQQRSSTDPSNLVPLNSEDPKSTPGGSLPNTDSQALSDKRSDMDNATQMQQVSPASYHMRTKIIVLREELEYYCLPGATVTSDEMTKLKYACGVHIRQNNMIFDALQKNIEKENNVAEQHLIDMLCEAGFGSHDRWGYRELEPMRACVVSMSLVLLRTSGSEDHVATAQKLLLFWRKPARKCWWDGDTVTVLNKQVRLWARRTWTLELALV